MQLDRTMAGGAAVIEMLVQVRQNIVYVFSVISKRWQNVSFQRISIPGRMQLNGCMENEEVKSVEIKNCLDTALYIVICGSEK